MNRISALLQKLQDLTQDPHPKTAIDADLMLDYARVLYADLLELRRSLPVVSPGLPASASTAPPPAAATPAPPAQAARPVPPRPTPPRPVPPRPVPAPVAPVIPQMPAFEEPTLAELSESLASSAAIEPEEEIAVAPPPPPPFPAPQQSLPEEAKEQDLRRFIGINDKYRFISGLFGNDVGTYERAIDSLNGLKSRSEANHWIRENLWIREDAETEEVLEAFRAAVAEHFAAR